MLVVRIDTLLIVPKQDLADIVSLQLSNSICRNPTVMGNAYFSCFSLTHLLRAGIFEASWTEPYRRLKLFGPTASASKPEPTLPRKKKLV